MATQTLKYSEIDPAVLTVLTSATVEGNMVRLTGQIDRKLYVDTNKVLENLGGKWNRGKKAHVFSEDPTILLQEVRESGQTAFANKNGFFPTPPELADRIVSMADLKSEHRVLEPSAGTGNLAAAILRAQPDCALTMVEFNPMIYAKLAKRDFGDSNCRMYEADFLAMSPFDYAFDRIVMNPPFERLADITHIRHAWDCLEPGGRLVSIMGSGCTFRSDKKAQGFRDFANAYGEIIELPAGSFLSSGTGVNTVVFVGNKPLVI